MPDGELDLLETVRVEMCAHELDDPLRLLLGNEMDVDVRACERCHRPDLPVAGNDARDVDGRCVEQPLGELPLVVARQVRAVTPHAEFGARRRHRQTCLALGRRELADRIVEAGDQHVAACVDQGGECVRELERRRPEHRRKGRVLVARDRAQRELEQHDSAAAECNLRSAVGAADKALPETPVRAQFVVVRGKQLVEAGAANFFGAFAEPDDRVRRRSVERLQPEVERLQSRSDVGLVVAGAAGDDGAVDHVGGERQRAPQFLVAGRFDVVVRVDEQAPVRRSVERRDQRGRVPLHLDPLHAVERRSQPELDPVGHPRRLDDVVGDRRDAARLSPLVDERRSVRRDPLVELRHLKPLARTDSL